MRHAATRGRGSAAWSAAVVASLLLQPLVVLLHLAASAHLPSGSHAHGPGQHEPHVHLHAHDHEPVLGDRGEEDHLPHPAEDHWDDVVKSPAPAKVEHLQMALAWPTPRPQEGAPARVLGRASLRIPDAPPAPPPRAGHPRAPPFVS